MIEQRPFKVLSPFITGNLQFQEKLGLVTFKSSRTRDEGPIREADKEGNTTFPAHRQDQKANGFVCSVKTDEEVHLPPDSLTIHILSINDVGAKTNGYNLATRTKQ